MLGMLAVADTPTSIDNVVDDDLVSDDELALVRLSCSFVENRVLSQSWLQLWWVHTQVSHAHFCGQGVVSRTSGTASVDFVDGCVGSTFIVQICVNLKRVAQPRTARMSSMRAICIVSSMIVV